ncbi:hypothetical protein JD844_014532 [Phrynosoma platyrhinos]|uniref:WD repeat domain 93 n=1 Tax=Phrynosoma platyrhinos TaxID=52577 RepID=A0ABQ7SRR0_PHRPL|nr:hypothetical protein JD844_014532 [Phrynosoma platyrhinos]
MPFYLRKQPQEIPSPTEKDWIKKDDEEDVCLKDPHEVLDSLPQHFRMINKIVTLLFDRAWEIIEGEHTLQETKQQYLAPTLYHPSDELQVTGRVNCLALSGGYIFAGLSTGLFVYSASTREKLCGWEATKLEICTLQVSALSGGSYLFGAIDELGTARLFYFMKENLIHIKAINEVVSPSLCLSGSSEVWLEIYRLPKDSWLKEMEQVQAVAVTSPGQSPGPGGENEKLKEVEASHPSLPEKTGSKGGRHHSSKAPVVGSEKDIRLKQHGKTEQKSVDIQAQITEEMPNPNDMDGMKWESINAMFHFHLPGRTLPLGTEIKAEPDMPELGHCSFLHSFGLLFSLDSDPKPDIVWPCAAPIAYSTITPCSSYLAFACEDRTVTVWDISIGFPLCVTVLPEGPQVPSQMISAMATIPTLPDSVLIFFWDGMVSLMDITTQENICHFIPPPTYKVASPWQPVFSVDREAQSGHVKGETEPIFLFNFTLYPLMETFAQEVEHPPDTLADLPWDQRCDTFLNDNLQRLSTISQQMPECWSQLQEYAAALTRGHPEEGPGLQESR